MKQLFSIPSRHTIALLAASAALCGSTAAETIYWTGGAGTADLLDPANWSTGAAFTGADSLSIDGALLSAPLVYAADAEVGRLQFTNKTASVTILPENGAALLMPGIHVDSTNNEIISSSLTGGTNHVAANIILSGATMKRINASTGMLWLSGVISEDTPGTSVTHSRNDPFSQRLITGLNTYSGVTVLNSDSLHVNTLGMTGEPSALGTNQRVEIGYRGSRASILNYIGPGETTDKTFQWGGGSGSSSFQTRGATGPVIFTGAFVFPDYGQFNLAGTNPGTNVVLCPITNPTNSGESNAISLSINTSTSDTAIWLLAGDNSHAGTTKVTAGTLLLSGDNRAATGLFDIEQRGRLGGTTTIGGSVEVMGTLAAGLPTGELAILGDLTIGEKDYGTIEVNPGTRLSAAGTFTTSGKWTVRVGEGFAAGGETVLLEYGALNTDTYRDPAITGVLPLRKDGTEAEVTIVNDGTRLLLRGIRTATKGTVILLH